MKRRDFLRATATAGIASAMVSFPPRLSALERWRFRATSAGARRRQRFPAMTLTTHDGQHVRLYDDLLAGKTVVLHFMYTSCTRSCPLTTANLARVRDLLGPRMGRDVFIYSITVDPTYDTPARLREYAELVDVSPGWLFLTGNDCDILALRKRLGDDPSRAFGGSNHLGLLAFGIEPLERWAACPAQLHPQWIVRYLSWLDPKGERPDGWWPAGHAAAHTDGPE